MSPPPPSTPSVCSFRNLQASVTPPRAPIPPPRLVRAAPPRDATTTATTSPSKKGQKRGREDTPSNESVAPPPQTKKRRALRPSNAIKIVPDLSSIPTHRNLRSHPRYDDYVAAFPAAVGPVEERKKIFEADWSVAKIVDPERVVCLGCKNTRKLNGAYYQPRWDDHRKTCHTLMARWMVKEGYATKEAAQCEGVNFDDSDTLPEQTSS